MMYKYLKKVIYRKTFLKMDPEHCKKRIDTAPRLAVSKVGSSPCPHVSSLVQKAVVLTPFSSPRVHCRENRYGTVEKPAETQTSVASG
jgi:hypothetical protein